MSRNPARSVMPAAAGSVRSVNYATSPLLASRTPPWRSRFVLLLLALAFAVLMGKAVHVQLVANEFYQAKGEEKFLLTEKLTASRGRILDRNGTLLASSVPLHSVQVDLRSFAASADERKALARLLGMTPAQLDDRTAGNRGTVLLRRHLEPAVWEQVKGLGLKGVHELREYKRRWPEGEAAAHIVGFTDVDDAGKSGAELAFQAELLGHAGTRTVVRDRLGRVVEIVGDPQEPRHGRDVTLSIDSRLQSFAWQQLQATVQAHGATAGSVVALDAFTGEVLAMANYPSFDPGKGGQRSGDKLRNIALAETFEPGSTMKPFSVALALERGPWTPASRVDTAPGRITIGDRTITDSHTYGVLSVAEIIQKSSNVGTVKIATQLPRQELWGWYDALGFGQRPDTPFQGVASGKLRPWKTWRPVEQASMSYGYALSASLLQMAQAYTVFARDGELIPVTLRKAGGAAADNAAGGGKGGAAGASGVSSISGQRVMSARTAQQMREMLQLATAEGGTAPLAQAQSLGYSVAGKTGTVRVHAKGRYTNKHRAFFVGLGPVKNPRVVVAVMVAEPSKGQFYAGQVAAPLFGQVISKTLTLLNVPPDLDVKAQVTAKPVEAAVESF